MTSRDRVVCLLDKKIPDRMGFYEHFWPETLDRYWAEQGYPNDADPVDFFDYDVREGPWAIDARLVRCEEDEVLEESEEWTVTRNGFGAVLKHWKEKSGTPEHIDFTVVTPEKWNEAKQPLLKTDPDRIDFAECKRFAEEARASHRFWTFGGLLQFELMRGTLGDVCMLENLLLDPEWIADFCGTYTDFYIRHFRLLFDEVGLPDGMFVYEDLGFSNGPFCSPKTYRELIFPQHQKLFHFFHKRGLPVIFHTCGDVRPLVPHLVEAGIDCLQPMEAKAGMDVIALAEQHKGQLAFMGNIDAVILNRNDPDEVRQHVTEIVSTLRQRGVPYVFHSDHSVPPGVRMETYQLAAETFRRECSYV